MRANDAQWIAIYQAECSSLLVKLYISDAGFLHADVLMFSH
ncbi:hypothetical protein V6Z12_A04G165600 [Gossypium hirsutum]